MWSRIFFILQEHMKMSFGPSLVPDSRLQGAVDFKFPSELSQLFIGFGRLILFTSLSRSYCCIVM